MKIRIRADASAQIGHGHVMRCLALAQALRERGAEVVFHSRPLVGNAFAAIEQAGFAVQSLQREGVLPACDWLIVDHYGLEAQWERAQRGNAKSIFVIDDLAGRWHDCDLFLDQNLAAARREASVPERCRQLLGPRYALLRRAFAEARVQLAPRSGKIERVLVCLGGGDPDNVTGQIVALISAAFPQLVLDVVVGAASPHIDTLRQRWAHDPQVRLGVAVDTMAVWMRDADFFIGASGSMSWERAVLSLPGIMLSLAENQRPIAQAIDAAGAGIDLGSAQDFQAARLLACMRELLATPDRVQAMSMQMGQLCDGDGAVRVAAAILDG
ncbi:UDP-2,4-diacetamido-2,4,6-trideoxy-beta-L-altropyranose hydrolase [Uliginosibacterium sediminicola]|uniref:UDP-2,4-diacetamido-2,4, 6-trideoxy-beta-L-altropyranose hydrolase n=1 Tax=Uliginosibacterium sediminicola TaxID=2024550 RepID=A0ABU9YVS2_9RHOO